MSGTMQGGAGYFQRRQPDPTTVIQAMALWSALQAATFILSGPLLMRGERFAALVMLGITRPELIAVTVLETVCVIASLLSISKTLRATVAIMSAALWLMYGGAIVWSSWHEEVVSTTGWCAVMFGIFSLRAVSQWAYVDA